jgi:hypothetical protein
MGTVHELRLSFIWVEAWPDLLGPNAAAAPFAALGRSTSYATTVNQLVTTGGSSLAGLTLPWVPKLGKSFWSLYVGRAVAQLAGEKAWNAVVPLRTAAPVEVDAPWLAPGRAWGEGFVYPHGVAFVFNATCVGQFPLSAPVLRLAWQVRNDQPYDVTWPDGTRDRLPLPAVADRALAALRRAALGREPDAIQTERRPFSVASVVRGQVDDPLAAVTDGGEVHTLLEGLTRWNANVDAPPSGPVEPHRLLTDNPSPGNLLYANPHGRAVWLPTWFGPPAKPGRPVRKVGCYHRNLTLACLQVESLALLCKMADAQAAAGPPPAGTYRDLAKRAAEILGRLHGGTRDTYRSASIPRHLDDNGWRDPIDNVRRSVGLAPLSPCR